ncbi:MAG: glycosyltransferase family 2 protein [Thermoanaerobaculia bacterium]
MITPSVSVVIPTRDRRALLKRSLASVFAQTFVDYEVIVVDDGSEVAVDCVKCGDRRVRVIRHLERMGAGAARNTGLAAAVGEFIAFLDDDDEWHADKLALQVNALHDAGPDAVLAYCGYELTLTQTGRVLERFAPDPTLLTFRDFFRRTYFGCSMPLIRASSLRAVGGFDTHLGGMQDRDLWLRLATHGRFVPVERVLVVCHVHGPSISTNVNVKIQAKRDFWTKHASTLSSDPGACARHWRRLAMLYFASGDGRNGRLCLGSAHEWAPLGWERHLHSLWSRLFPRSHARYITRSVFRGIDGLRWYS